MKELRYAASSAFFLSVVFLLYLAYTNIAPYVGTMVQIIVFTVTLSFCAMMIMVSIAIWKAFAVSERIEEKTKKVTRRKG